MIRGQGRELPDSCCTHRLGGGGAVEWTSGTARPAARRGSWREGARAWRQWIQTGQGEQGRCVHEWLTCSARHPGSLQPFRRPYCSPAVQGTRQETAAPPETSLRRGPTLQSSRGIFFPLGRKLTMLIGSAPPWAAMAAQVGAGYGTPKYVSPTARNWEAG